MSEGNNNITIGQLTETINNKMDRDGLNANTSCIFVVSKQDPTPENGYTWYRKYSDGWVEQGGVTGAVTRTGISISLPVTMSHTNYNIIATVQKSSVINELGLTAIPTAVDSFTLFLGAYNGGAPNLPCYWQVSGIAA